MATGMQTGMRTGSRAGLTAGRGAPAKPAGGLGKVKDVLAGLSKGMKIGIAVFISCFVLGLGAWYLHSASTKEVDLYTTKLSPADVKDVAQKLTELQIAHQVNVTGDGVLIAPSLRSKAQVQLASYGLPKHAIKTPTNTPSDGLSAKTSAEQKALRQQMLEGELTESLRQFEGVADAYVKIAQPEETFFKDDSKPMTATVMLKLTPGTQLGEKQVMAIVHLVSFSVPDLDKKNVKVVDSTMTDLTAQIEASPDGGISSGKQGEMENAKANEMTKKAQSQLDAVFGAGRTKVAVNCEMDFTQEEIKNRTVGGPGDNGQVVVGEQKKTEVYRKNPDGTTGSGTEGTQMDGEEGSQASLPSGAKKDSNYEQAVISKKVVHNQSDSTIVRKTPKIQRLTCSVAVNNLKEDQVSKIAGLVQGAIGLDENRGDKLVVNSVPFYQKTLETAELENLAKAMGNRPAAGAAVGGDGNKNAFSQMGIGLSILSLGALTLIGVFLMKQHRVQVGKSQLVLDSSFSGSTSTDIADLVNDKSGKSNSNAETKVNTSDALEKLAKEKPTKVAEMLKSTWLNG